MKFFPVSTMGDFPYYPGMKKLNDEYSLTVPFHLGINAKSEVLGKPIFEHVPKDAWETMNDSLKTWFETGKVTDRKITFKRQDGSTFPGLLQATSLYDENKNLLGSNTVIFDLTQMTDEKIKEYEEFFKMSNDRLDEIKEKEYEQFDKDSKSEYDGLKQMFEMLLGVNLKELKE